MSRRRFYVPPEQIHDGVAELPPDQAHRLRHVLRLRKNHEVEVLDGRGAVYLGRVHAVGRQLCVVDLKQLTGPEPSTPALILAPSVIKPARFEWMLEKATELGVDEFMPLITKHSDFHISEENLRTRLERWRRIIRQACEQCGRAVVPAIRTPVLFPDFLKLDELSRFERLLCYEKGGTQLSRGAPAGPIALCIGPEGGWDSSEIEAALRADWKLVSLGRSTLRAETAALAAIALIRIAD